MTGWIKSIRKSKDIMFLGVTTGSENIQITLPSDCVILGELSVGASIKSSGSFGLTPKGEPEFVATLVSVIGTSDSTYPIQPKRHTDDFLRTIPEMRGKTNKYQAISKLRHCVSQSIHDYFNDRGFYQYFAPIMVDSDCEGAGETFKVSSDWLERELTVSSQLYGEVGAMSLGRVYTFSPCFRAEKSATRKHLAEFWMIEPEMIDYDLDNAIECAEELIRVVFSNMIDNCKAEFKQLGVDTNHLELSEDEFPRVRYSEIVEKFGLKHGDDIDSVLEKTIVDYYEGPVFITHYPKELKPFYMKKDDKWAYCFDLIFPEVGEMIGGSERECNYETLIKNMEGMDLEKMEWYTNTRKWGSITHSGFGLGLERLLMYITKASKVHDVIPFPISY